MLSASLLNLLEGMAKRDSIALTGGLSRLLNQRIVFRPCGQFHGWSIVPMCCTMVVIWRALSTLPTITLERHASIANSLRVFEGRLRCERVSNCCNRPGD